MKKSVLIFVFFCLICGMGLSAQSLTGRYIHAHNLNNDDIEINQIVVSVNGADFRANWETALATGENEKVTKLQNVTVDTQDLKISFDKDGQSHQGQFVSDGDGGYNLIMDGQTIYARNDW